MKASSLTTRESRLAWILATVGGLVLFIYFVERVGIEEIATSVRRVGWAFLLVLLLSGLRFLARSAAWLLCVPSGHNLTLRHIFPAVLAGDAVGNLTPLSVLVGEPVKALYLRHRIGLSRIVPALAVENLFYTLSTVIIIAVGCASPAAIAAARQLQRRRAVGAKLSRWFFQSGHAAVIADDSE